MNKLGFFFSFILLIIQLYSVVISKTDDAQFKLRINERGTSFTEKISVSENENTVSFTVPKHNNVNRSEVLNDFNLGLTITRVPDVGICHIKPLENILPNPVKLKDDMNYVNRLEGKTERKPSVRVSSTEWTIDEKLDPRDLEPAVAKFCRDLPVYSLKEASKNGNDTHIKRHRRFFNICPEAIANGNSVKIKCSTDDWMLNCKFVLSGTCVWWVNCTVPIKKVNNDWNNCDFSHDWTSIMCCVPWCKI
ncbi:uncharacterized protein LOC114529981 [Dendronephthya gigantea]|uniref:uncharacterized protein LOC114529981 n=1 Tax=Dendronephthya gigantea TaxID=151771 RepID=UPI00106B7931|nr:uncharacterized protein LOC114529981 [Dendronephthya gigantea]